MKIKDFVEENIADLEPREACETVMILLDEMTSGECMEIVEWLEDAGYIETEE